MFYNFIIFLLDIFVNIFFPYKLKGINNFKNAENGFILCSNHISNIDPIFFMVINHKFRNDCIFFLAKKELFKGKFLTWLFKEVGAIPISRGKKDDTALNIAQEKLKIKKNLGVFIEGTRSKTGLFLRPRAGAVLLSVNTESKILPVCITPKDNKIKIFTRTIINFGEPIDVKKKLNLNMNSSIKEIKNASNFVMDCIKFLR